MGRTSTGNGNDNEYKPSNDESSEDSYSSSYASTSSRSSGYDPLQNMEEYIKMRDQL